MDAFSEEIIREMELFEEYKNTYGSVDIEMFSVELWTQTRWDSWATNTYNATYTNVLNIESKLELKNPGGTFASRLVFVTLLANIKMTDIDGELATEEETKKCLKKMTNYLTQLIKIRIKDEIVAWDNLEIIRNIERNEYLRCYVYKK